MQIVSYILITLQSCPIEIKEVRSQKENISTKQKQLKLKNHDSQNVPGAGCLCVNDSSQTSSSQTQLLLQSCLVLLGRSGRILWRRMSVWSNDGSMWSSLSPGSWSPLWRSRGQLWSLWHGHDVPGQCLHQITPQVQM